MGGDSEGGFAEALGTKDGPECFPSEETDDGCSLDGKPPQSMVSICCLIPPHTTAGQEETDGINLPLEMSDSWAHNWTSPQMSKLLPHPPTCHIDPQSEAIVDTGTVCDAGVLLRKAVRMRGTRSPRVLCIPHRLRTSEKSQWSFSCHSWQINQMKGPKELTEDFLKQTQSVLRLGLLSNAVK